MNHKPSFLTAIFILYLGGVTGRSHRWTSTGFVRSRYLTDGEHERRVHWKKITAMDTAVEFPAESPDVGNRTADSFDNAIESGGQSQGLVLRQVTDGRHFIQLIYDWGMELRDCEYVKDRDIVEKFLAKFKGDFACAANRTWENSPCDDPVRNETFLILRDHRFPPQDVAAMTGYPKLRKECRDLHRKIRSSVKGRTEKGRPFLDRIKRDIFLYPGTNWCGSGSSARKFNELGYNAAADRCCRDHDHCPYTIEAFTKKFNFFNYRFHTVSHCECDERFRACLKLASTGAANMVGKLFFNVVQTKCFVFKPVKTCIKRSWWGKCMRQEKIKTAHLRDALIY